VNDNATLVIGSGNYLTAAVGAALPADLRAPGVAWTNVGHTSLEDIFGLTSEGGEATVLGTLQNKSLRTKYSTRQETMTFTLQQFDEDGLKLFFGSNAVDVEAGRALGVPTDPTPTTCAFLAVFIDGDNEFAFYAPKAEVYRGDDMSLSDTENLAGLPLAVKPLVHGGNAWTYAVTPLGGA
jgi:hypothetical protein